MEFSVYGDYVRFTIEQRILYQPEAVGSPGWAAARARMDTMRSVAAEIAARITPDYTENISAYLRADSSGRQKLSSRTPSDPGAKAGADAAVPARGQRQGP